MLNVTSSTKAAPNLSYISCDNSARMLMNSFFDYGTCILSQKHRPRQWIRNRRYHTKHPVGSVKQDHSYGAAASRGSGTDPSCSKEPSCRYLCFRISIGTLITVDEVHHLLSRGLRTQVAILNPCMCRHVSDILKILCIRLTSYLT